MDREWVESMNWKGLQPVVELSRKALPEGRLHVQERHAGDRSTADLNSALAKMGYFDSPCLGVNFFGNDLDGDGCHL